MGTDGGVESSRYDEHLTRDDCVGLLRHAHVIPMSRGTTAAYLRAHLPGWSWNELVQVFVAAGIYVNRGGTPATCPEEVVRFHFSAPTQFLVEWADGVEPPDVRERRLAGDVTVGQYAYRFGDRIGFSIGGAEPPVPGGPEDPGF